MPSSPTMNHPLLLLVLWVSVFIISTFFSSSSVSADFDKQYTNCSNSFNCGFVSNVSFPFWGYNRADYCGLPEFQLDCENNVPKLIVNSTTYRILDFNLNQQNLTVVRDDYWSSICPSDIKNNTIDGSPFNYDESGLYYLALLYDCINTFNPSNLFVSSNCPSGSTQNMYYGNKSFSTNLEGVCEVVIMPIFQSYTEQLFQNQISLQNVIKNGFGLQWSDARDGECQSCVNKLGGECGYSDSKFTCFCKNGPCSSGPSSKGGKLIIAIGASAAVGIVMAILTVIICDRKRCFKSRQSKIPKARGRINDHQIETFMETYGTLAPRRYTYSEVKRMTKSFTTKIGEGGYGIVYKAIMPDASIVAVKVISETKGNGEEFINEVGSISRTSHVNIVSLLGFCYEKNKRALIYEFMPNGSLDKFIFKPNSSTAICGLEWLKMYQISIGIARGLEYLHQGCNTRILHLDIKPQNILLDEEFRPKISDFGLAKICQKKESIVSILGTRGTIGYIAPEVFSRTYGGVSHKSDVYSYGMLVLEMIGARKNYESGGSHSSEMYFPDWIYKDLENSNDVVTGNVSINEEDKELVRKMTLVSLWCIQTNPSDRPPMNKVVEMLEGSIESLSIPPKPLLQSPPRAPLQLLDESYSSSMLDSNSRITETE